MLTVAVVDVVSVLVPAPVVVDPEVSEVVEIAVVLPGIVLPDRTLDVVAIPDTDAERAESESVLVFEHPDIVPNVVTLRELEELVV